MAVCGLQHLTAATPLVPEGHCQGPRLLAVIFCTAADHHLLLLPPLCTCGGCRGGCTSSIVRPTTPLKHSHFDSQLSIIACGVCLHCHVCCLYTPCLHPPHPKSPPSPGALHPSHIPMPTQPLVALSWVICCCCCCCLLPSSICDNSPLGSRGVDESSVLTATTHPLHPLHPSSPRLNLVHTQ
jgi:hypothetical protein